MSHPIQQHAFLKDFTCLGKDCPDTCCYGWNMQINKEHQQLYAEKAPELMAAIDTAASVMRRDPETDYCVKFSSGLCGIQTEYGGAYLGDACHFYPRITRKLGDELLMTAALSCPEITRLALFSDTPFTLVDTTIERLPTSQMELMPETITTKQAQQITAQFLTMASEAPTSPQRIIARLLTVARSLDNLKQENWAEALEFYLPTADGRLAAPEIDSADPYRVLHALALLISSAPKVKRERLYAVVSTMEKGLDCHINWKTREILSNSTHFTAYTTLQQRWQKQAAAALDPILRRWIQAQLAMVSYPFWIYGQSLLDRTIVLALRFVTVRLALMSHVAEDGTPPDSETVIRIVHTLSRFLDHLSDPELSLIIYQDAGWMSDGRLRGLLEDHDA